MTARYWLAGSLCFGFAIYSGMGCGDSNDESTFNSGGSSGSNNGGTSSGGTSSGGTSSGGTSSGGTSSGGTSSGGTSSGGTGGSLIIVDGGGGSSGNRSDGGSPEVCDGKDNDGNGIIDDVDKGKDGICDCLRIATIGEAGVHGAGDVFADWLNSRSDNGAIDLKGIVLTEVELAKYQVIVVQNIRKDPSAVNRDYSAAEVAALKQWVDGGGGVMTMIGFADSSERANVNTLLAPFEVNYGPEQILQKGGGSTVPINTWFDHPTRDGVTRVGVDNGYPVNGKGFVVARGTERDDATKSWDIARAVTSGKGKVFVWGDEWISYNSEWNDHPDYQVSRLWLNVIKWLTPQKECQVEIPPVIPD